MLWNLDARIAFLHLHLLPPHTTAVLYISLFPLFSLFFHFFHILCLLFFSFADPPTSKMRQILASPFYSSKVTFIQGNPLHPPGSYTHHIHIIHHIHHRTPHTTICILCVCALLSPCVCLTLSLCVPYSLSLCVPYTLPVCALLSPCVCLTLSLCVPYSLSDLKRCRAHLCLAIFMMANKFSGFPDDEDSQTGTPYFIPLIHRVIMSTMLSYALCLMPLLPLHRININSDVRLVMFDLCHCTVVLNITWDAGC